MQNQQKRTAGRNGTNLEQAHLLNQRVVLNTIRLFGPVSRVEIARTTKLTNQTIFNIVDGLVRADLIQQLGLKTAERGQPAKLFELNPDGAFSIGLHMERDHIAAVLVDLKGVVRERTYRTDYFATREEALKQALSAIRELQRKCNRKRIWGLGIALPGPTDSPTGRVMSMPNFPGWENFNVRDYFQKKCGLHVALDNDANAAAIGESWYGIGRTLSSFFYLYMGIGVGGGIILDGRPFRGFRGTSGEIGHITVDRTIDARLCGCGKRGCLEAYTSLTSLYQHLRKSGLRNTDLARLTKLFDQHNKALMSWLDAAALFVSEALWNIQLVLDPEAFVIGGHLPGPLLAFICDQCVRRTKSSTPLPPRGTESPHLLQGVLQDEAAAIGAAALPTHDLTAPHYERITSGGHLSLLDLGNAGLAV